MIINAGITELIAIYAEQSQWTHTPTISSTEMRSGGWTAKRERNQNMSSFNFMDFTVAGAYESAVTAAYQSDHRNAKHHTGPSDGPRRSRVLSTLIRRVASAVAERRSTALRLASRRV